jgi:hypothetical protein
MPTRVLQVQATVRFEFQEGASADSVPWSG